MKRKVEYIIEEDIAIALKKVAGAISTRDLWEKYKLTPVETELLSEFYSLVQDEEEEE